MQVVIVEPEKKPRVQSIEDSLASMQKIVGGTIQAVYPFDEPVALICNDEGKLLSLPLNRALRDSDGRVYDIVAGTFFLCGATASSDRFDSLTEDFLKRFSASEQFVRVGDAVFVLPEHL